MVRDYLAQWSHAELPDQQWYARQALRDAVINASRALASSGKRHPHQYRITRAAIRGAETKLLAALSKLEAAKSFEVLHDLIVELLRDVRGTGELYCYDAACRIGAALKLAPNKVYLHAGTRLGARYLVTAAGRNSVDVGEFPLVLRKLGASHIENLLCIYKDDLRRLAGRGAIPGSR